MYRTFIFFFFFVFILGCSEFMDESRRTTTPSTTDGINCRESFELCGVSFEFVRVDFDMDITATNNNDVRVYAEVLNVDDGGVFLAKCLRPDQFRTNTVHLEVPTIIQMNLYPCESDYEVSREQPFCDLSGETCSLY